MTKTKELNNIVKCKIEEESCKIFVNKTKNGRNFLKILIESNGKSTYFNAFETKHYERLDTFRGDFEFKNPRTGLIDYKVDKLILNSLEAFKVSFLRNNYEVVKTFMAVKNLAKVNSSDPDYTSETGEANN